MSEEGIHVCNGVRFEKVERDGDTHWRCMHRACFGTTFLKGDTPGRAKVTRHVAIAHPLEVERHLAPRQVAFVDNTAPPQPPQPPAPQPLPQPPAATTVAVPFCDGALAGRDSIDDDELVPGVDAMDTEAFEGGGPSSQASDPRPVLDTAAGSGDLLQVRCFHKTMFRGDDYKYARGEECGNACIWRPRCSTMHNDTVLFAL